jgi:hypothetical protein
VLEYPEFKPFRIDFIVSFQDANKNSEKGKIAL